MKHKTVMKRSISLLKRSLILMTLPAGMLLFTSHLATSTSHCTNFIGRDLSVNYLMMNHQTPDTMDTIVDLQKRMTLVHEVAIQTTPDRIWDFLVHIDENYTAWHPADHLVFRWTEGAPFSAGSAFYAEQYMMGEKVKYRGKITESVPGEKITMTFSFPLSLITEKIEMVIENHGTHSTFRHITYMRFKLLSRTIFKKQNIRMLNDMDAHVKTEGENMKRILE
jgi:uncharacterized protein YndB with AHSA1/START domain